MGWSKTKGLRLHFERKDKSYILVDTSSVCLDGSYECIGNCMEGPTPSLCTTSCSPNYLYTKCRRASWDEMPERWVAAMKPWVTDKPEGHKGLWKI